MSRSTAATPVPLDLLRRHAIALGTAAGLPPARAADLAHHVLWYEVLGASRFGLEALPKWLAGPSVGRLDLHSDGPILDERTGTARLDASRTLAPLAMSQAAAVAAEKARENGVAVIRVENLAEPCPAGDAAAREALGPLAVAILTARPGWVVALPGAGELPFLADSDLEAKPASTKSRASRAPSWVAMLAPMLAGFAPSPGGAMVVALHVSALDALDRFHDRLAASARREGVWLAPAKLGALRQEAERGGIVVPEVVQGALGELARQLSVPELDA